ncbi:MAG: hypothetical protein AAF449_08010 [Myxococcota bacterium]
MRITAVRAWFNQAVHRGVGAARRATAALSKRVRGYGRGVDRSVGVGDDESEFGGKSARIWFEWMEEARERLLTLFEHSFFERVPALQKLVRRFLGRSSTPPPPRLPPSVKPSGPLGAHTSNFDANDQAYIQRRLQQAHLSEHAGLRDEMARSRATDKPDEE